MQWTEVIIVWTCVMSAPRPCRPESRSWWRSTGSAESGGPSPSWARPKRTEPQTNLNLWAHNYIQTETETFSLSAYGKDLRFMPVWTDLHSRLPIYKTFEARLDCTHMAPHLDPRSISLINPRVKTRKPHNGLVSFLLLANSPAAPALGSQSWRWLWRVCVCCLHCKSPRSSLRTLTDPASGCPTLQPRVGKGVGFSG